ncbi:MAG TPA: GTP cyclohydrolase II [Pyrinomonadaceae bacterium]|jgi:GTP cyclohydrolase II|nr:GTP cyclohydrolase II [Pyrinomonadaceae bacterium]
MFVASQLEEEIPDEGLARGEGCFFAQTRLPTRYGALDVRIYVDQQGKEHLAISTGEIRKARDLPVRIHSECLTGEVLGSTKCDCKQQLEVALNSLQMSGCGLVLYLRQEGRGIGLANKIRAYALQEQGHDTVDANHLLGLPDDARTYEAAALMLRQLEVSSVLLMTNNPAKIEALRHLGIEITGRIPLVIRSDNEQVASYLATKQARMGHLLEDAEGPAPTSAAQVSGPSKKVVC